MRKLLAAAAFGGVFFTAFAASAQGAPAGLTLCFDSQVSNVAIVPQIDFVESAVVVTDASGNAIVKADSLYGKDSTVGKYWTSAYPANITLPAGCSTISFMVKNTPPSTGTQWMCAAPVVSTGPTNAAGTASSVVNGVIGGSLLSGAALIPAMPNKAPTTTTTCPQGY